MATNIDGAGVLATIDTALLLAELPKPLYQHPMGDHPEYLILGGNTRVKVY